MARVLPSADSVSGPRSILCKNTGGTFQIEPDASSASYFHAINAMYPDLMPINVMSGELPKADGGSGWQIDAEFPRKAPTAGSIVAANGAMSALPLDVWKLPPVACRPRQFGALDDWKLPPTAAKRPAGAHSVSRKTELGDSIMTAIAIAPLASKPYSFTDLGVLRKQECERVKALTNELIKCNALVTEVGDTLEILPRSVHTLGRTMVHTYHDHRMAMCFATLGLVVAGIKLEDPSCVRKTVPSFFQILAAPPPEGLGVEIWECEPKSGKRVRRLSEPADLIAGKK